MCGNSGSSKRCSDNSINCIDQLECSSCRAFDPSLCTCIAANRVANRSTSAKEPLAETRSRYYRGCSSSKTYENGKLGNSDVFGHHPDNSRPPPSTDHHNHKISSFADNINNNKPESTQHSSHSQLACVKSEPISVDSDPPPSTQHGQPKTRASKCHRFCSEFFSRGRVHHDTSTFGGAACSGDWSGAAMGSGAECCAGSHGHCDQQEASHQSGAHESDLSGSGTRDTTDVSEFPSRHSQELWTSCAAAAAADPGAGVADDSTRASASSELARRLKESSGRQGGGTGQPLQVRGSVRLTGQPREADLGRPAAADLPSRSQHSPGVEHLQVHVRETQGEVIPPDLRGHRCGSQCRRTDGVQEPELLHLAEGSQVDCGSRGSCELPGCHDSQEATDHTRTSVGVGSGSGTSEEWLLTLDPTSYEITSEPENLKDLSEAASKQLNNSINHLSTPAVEDWASIFKIDRVDLLELCCPSDSPLSAAVASAGGTSERIGLHNGYNMATSTGFNRAMNTLKACRPRKLWISTPCGPNSPLQNANQRTDQQIRDLMHKRRVSKRIIANCLEIAKEQLRQGGDVYWEWPNNNLGWQYRDIRRALDQLFVVRCDGCCFGHRDVDSKRLYKKSWKVMTSDAELQAVLGKRCQGNHEHEIIEGQNSLGSRSAQSARYPQAMCKAIVRHILRTDLEWCDALYDFHSNCKNMDPENHPQELFPADVKPTIDKKLRRIRGKQTKRSHPIPEEQAPVEEAEPVDEPDEFPEFDKVEREKIMSRLHHIHKNLGHCSNLSLKQLLRRSKVSPRVIKLVDEIECSICKEFRKCESSRPAAIHDPGKGQVMATDGFNFDHPENKLRSRCQLMIDEATRLVRIVVFENQSNPQHKLSNTSISEIKNAVTHDWIATFGKPQVIRSDPEGCSFSSELFEWAQERGIFWDLTPGQAHWQLDICERHVEILRQIMIKLAVQFPDASTSEIAALASQSHNDLVRHRGVSPFTLWYGERPKDLIGDVLLDNPDHATLSGELSDAYQKRQLEMSIASNKATFDALGSEKLRRAALARSRKFEVFQSGQWVYYWRKKKGSHIKPGRWYGPAMVLKHEVKSDVSSTDGSNRPGSCVWLVVQGRLLKCATEQVRPATKVESEMAELLVDSAFRDVGFQRATGLLRKGQYLDVSDEAPKPQEMDEAPVPVYVPAEALRHLPPLIEDLRQPPARLSHKEGEIPERLLKDTLEVPEDNQGNQQEHHRARVPSGDSDTLMPDLIENDKGPHSDPSSGSRSLPPSHPPLPEGQPPEKKAKTEEDLFYQVSLSIDLDKDQLCNFSSQGQVYLTTLLRRKRVEVNLKRLSPNDYKAFEHAKDKEIKEWLRTEAVRRALRSGIDPQALMKMRWILTWKNEGQLAKARLVIQGYTDPDLLNLRTDAPTCSRSGRHIFLLKAAELGFDIEKGDISSAFLQSGNSQEHRQVFAEPVPELVKALGLKPNEVVQILNATYGLTVAPREFYLHFSRTLKRLGATELKSEPCIYVVKDNHGNIRAIISQYVDDVMIAGKPGDSIFETFRRQLNHAYRWGSWEKNDFVQCGVEISKVGNSFRLSQHKYAETLQPIEIYKHRKSFPKAPITEYERTQLRGACGAGQWIGTQACPWVTARTSYLQGKIPEAKVEDLLEANKLIQEIKNHCRVPIWINPHKNLCFAVWHDAAWASRHDGHSQGGFMLCAVDQTMLEGQESKCSIISWGSKKLPRVARSSASAEVQGMSEALEELEYVRFAWGELNHGLPNSGSDYCKLINLTRACTISDCKVLYDSLNGNSSAGCGMAEKRSAIEVLALRQRITQSQTEVRWVHSHAEVGDGLTKSNTDAFRRLLQFIQAKTWRIVEDPLFESARKRKQKGLGILEYSGEKVQPAVDSAELEHHLDIQPQLQPINYHTQLPNSILTLITFTGNI